MTHTLLDPFSAVGLPESADPAAASAAAYANEVVELLSGLLLGLVRERQPELEPALRGERPPSELSPDLMARTLQVQGLWFQLRRVCFVAPTPCRNTRSSTTAIPSLIGTGRVPLDSSPDPNLGWGRNRYCPLPV